MTWQWSKFDDRGLARFVSRDVANLIRLAENRLDLVRQPNGRRQLVAVIYDTLLNLEPKIRYAPEKHHPSEAMQLVRTPNEILEMPGEGTCLDLALLFCGLCLGNELLPLLIILDGHALAAVSLNHSLPEWDALTRQRRLTGDEPLTDIAYLRELIDSGQYLAIECTGFAESSSLPETSPEGKGRDQGFLPFERAVSAGREQLEEANILRFALDIATAHYKWRLDPNDIRPANPDRQLTNDFHITRDENSSRSTSKQESSQLSNSNTTSQPSNIPVGLDLMFGVLNSKLEHLSSALSQERARKLEEFRELYREGHFERAYACLNTLRQDPDWDVFDKPLQAQILQALAGYVLNTEQNLERARTLADQAYAIDPESHNTVLTILLVYYSEGPEAALNQMAPPFNVDSFNLQLALLLELRRVDEVIARLNAAIDELELDAETDRIHALALLDKGDILGAQVKIQQACYKKPTWKKIQVAAAVINYNSVLSPTLSRYSLDSPRPIDWSFILQDAESLQKLRNAATVFRRLASETEQNESQRHYWQEWYLACLANDPEQQVEAKNLCQTLLAQDPTNPHIIAWATTRNYGIDLTASQDALEALVASSQQDLEQIICLVEMYLSFHVSGKALQLLDRAKEQFDEAGYSEVWLFWHIQSLLSQGELETALDRIDQFQDEATQRNVRLGVLREQARVSHNWREFAQHLEVCWQESQHNLYLYELCQIWASLGDWQYVSNRADELVDSMRTPDSLRLSVQCAWRSGHYLQCLQLLNDHQHFFPSGALPPDLYQLKIYCQARSGLISQAIAEAEELVHSQETIETLTTLMDLQLNQGNLRGLAQTASRLLRQEEVQLVPLLQAARYTLSEDRNLARQLWQRAITVEITPDILGEVISLGYNLGLDREVQPFIHRAQVLAITGQGAFQAVGVHELLEMGRQWQEHGQEINQHYDRAQSPIHFVAQARRLPLALYFHTLPQINESNPDPHTQASTLARYGARPYHNDLSLD